MRSLLLGIAFRDTMSADCSRITEKTPRHQNKQISNLKKKNKFVGSAYKNFVIIHRMLILSLYYIYQARLEDSRQQFEIKIVNFNIESKNCFNYTQQGLQKLDDIYCNLKLAEGFF